MPAQVSRQAPGCAPLRSATVLSIANRMLQALSLPDRELSVLLTNDEFIHELNRTHRGKDRPTDVLAFPQLDEATGELAEAGEDPVEDLAGQDNLLGDVVISIDTAERQARTRRHSLVDEVRFLLAHGLLHLIGYDHQTDEEEAAMNARTKQLVAATK